MPSPLETLVKILKLERDQDVQNNAVVGGLGAFGENWKRQAMPHARRAEHVILIEELVDLLHHYGHLDQKAARLKQINYMLDRITGRAPIPSLYQPRLDQLRAEMPPPEAASQKPAAPPPRENRSPRPERERRDPRPPRERPVPQGNGPRENIPRQGRLGPEGDVARENRPRQERFVPEGDAPRPDGFVSEGPPLRDNVPPPEGHERFVPPSGPGAPRDNRPRPEGPDKGPRRDKTAREKPNRQTPPPVQADQTRQQPVRRERPERLDRRATSENAAVRPTQERLERGDRRDKRREPPRPDAPRSDAAPVPPAPRPAHFVTEAPPRPPREREDRNTRKPRRESDTSDSMRLSRDKKAARATAEKLAAITTPEWTGDTPEMDYRPASMRGENDVHPLPRLTRPPRRPRAMLTIEEARLKQQALHATVMKVKGVGGVLAKNLEALKLHTINDLLHYIPRRYDDYTRLAYIKQLQPETIATVIGKVGATDVKVGKNGRKDFYMRLDDASGTLDVTFFAQHYLIRSIRKGMTLVISGKVAVFRNTLQMTNPDWEELDTENLHTMGIVPVYRLSEGVPERTLRRVMKRTVDDWTDSVPEIIPYATRERADLADIGWAIRQLHFPEGYDHLDHARRRYLFDQLIVMQLAILRNRRDWQSLPGHALTVDDEFLETFTKTVFPYALTGAQNRSIDEIRRDIAKPLPMNRLIQGDVGSGKTAVAITAMAMTLANGKQAALMAPTSILAEQHYRNFDRIFENWTGEYKPVIALLTSALTTTERESIYRGLADGSIDLVVGTHALIQPNLAFKALALVIIDEQHRFGVEQRGRLRGKGINPHLLVMTATPIPRTLALTLYADLDLSIIDEKPPGRQPVKTRILGADQREKAMGFIENQIEQGRQAFIIHPLVEASETLDVRSAVESYQELKQMFPKRRICLLHGRMKPAEKDEIMAAFSRHEYDLMVTTSVAEVGVDIPNASVIMIEGANRFGLAQLHQFRGRVGRGQHASWCLLVPDNDLPQSQERLDAMVQTDDGFLLAEYDWKIRGAGDLLGTRQSGALAVRLAEFITPELVTMAQREARTLYEADPNLEAKEHALLADAVNRLYADSEGDIS